ncbi:hypothetical protein Tco_0410890 [Tanacetum coccineum]
MLESAAIIENHNNKINVAIPAASHRRLTPKTNQTIQSTISPLTPITKPNNRSHPTYRNNGARRRGGGHGDMVAISVDGGMVVVIVVAVGVVVGVPVDDGLK